MLHHLSPPLPYKVAASIMSLPAMVMIPVETIEPDTTSFPGCIHMGAVTPCVALNVPQQHVQSKPMPASRDKLEAGTFSTPISHVQ
jgi:hypothetical protein